MLLVFAFFAIRPHIRASKSSTNFSNSLFGLPGISNWGVLSFGKVKTGGGGGAGVGGIFTPLLGGGFVLSIVFYSLSGVC